MPRNASTCVRIRILLIFLAAVVILCLVILQFAPVAPASTEGSSDFNHQVDEAKAGLTTVPTISSHDEDDVYAPPAALPDETITLQVAAWGGEVSHRSGLLTLRAISQQPGDQPFTTRVNLELCALARTALPDTGPGSDILQVLQLQGMDQAAPHAAIYASSVITIDNSATHVVSSMDGDINTVAAGHDRDLAAVLDADDCAPVQVEVYKPLLNDLVVGFSFRTDPMGELESTGGFTRLQMGAPATTMEFMRVS